MPTKTCSSCGENVGLLTGYCYNTKCQQTMCLGRWGIPVLPIPLSGDLILAVAGREEYERQTQEMIKSSKLYTPTNEDNDKRADYYDSDID